MVAPKLNSPSPCLTILSSDSANRRIDSLPVTPYQMLLSQSSNCGFIKTTSIFHRHQHQGSATRNPCNDKRSTAAPRLFLHDLSRLKACTHRLYR